MIRALVVVLCFAVLASACTSDAVVQDAEAVPGTEATPETSAVRVERPELHPVLDRAPLHSEIASHMPPGALAALEVETIISGFDAHAHASVAARIWEIWEDRLAVCADTDDFQRQPLTLPTANDSFWDPVRIPRDAFRPYTEEWNRSYAFGFNEARDFFENSDPVAALERTLDFGACHESTYPFASLIAYEDLLTSPTPLNDLAVVAARETPTDDELRASWSSALASLSASQLLDGLADWESCMAELGAPPIVTLGDFHGALATFDRDAEVEVALLDIACSRDIFAAIDVELLAASINFAEENEALLLDELDQTDAIEMVLAEAAAG